MAEQATELAKTLGEIYEQGKYDTGVFGKIFVAKGYADLSAKEFNLTVQWGVSDVERYRLIGLHIPYTPGSLIRWNQVDWDIYDTGGPPESAVNNVFRDVLRRK